MKMPFGRRRALKSFAEAIRPELQSLPAPEPSPELLARILASREAGVRIILPDAASDRRSSRPMLVAAAVIAAALLLIVIPRGRTNDRLTDEAWVSPAFFGNAAFAQPPAAGPALPPMTLERARNVTPRVVQFSRRLRDSTGRLTSDLRGDLMLSHAVLDGEPAWKIVSLEHDSSAMRRHADAETLYIARSDLRLLRRAVHVTPYHRFQRINILQRFQGDSITGRMTTDGPSIGEGRGIARQLNPAYGPYLSDAMVPILLVAEPLDRQWQRSASLLGWAVVPNDIFVPLAMRVVGEETVTVPAGTFDCWRIAIRFSNREISYWARKSDGLGVRVFEGSRPSFNGTREVVLVSVK